MKVGIRDFKQNGGEIRDQIESMHGMPKTTLGITGLNKNLGRDDEIEKPDCRGPPMVVFRRPKSLKDMLVHSELKGLFT